MLLMSLPDYAMPGAGLVGGLLIGLAAALLLLGIGRIAGVSGLAARTLGLGGDAPWPVAAAFIVGLPVGALLVASGLGPVTVTFPELPATLITGGLLVGLGTRMGSGCTSGHGVCGLSRLSTRSLVATLSFMATGIVTVWMMGG
jgi:uncharacterized membrane protein YedE/YeeE